VRYSSAGRSWRRRARNARWPVMTFSDDLQKMRGLHP
jgi:hypothetical protein